MDDALRYPPSICAYEMENGILRHEINGAVYLVADEGVMHVRLDKAKAQRENDYRLWLFSKTPENFTDWLRPRDEERKGRGT